MNKLFTRVFILIAFLLGFAVILNAANNPDKDEKDKKDKTEKIKKGWNIGGLPVVSFDSDLGLQLGALVNLYHYGDTKHESAPLGFVNDVLKEFDDVNKIMTSY